MLPDDDTVKGQLLPVAPRLVMKLMWLCRTARPDVTFAVNTLAKHITIWSVNDDRRAARLLGCLSTTVDLLIWHTSWSLTTRWTSSISLFSATLEDDEEINFWLCHCVGRQIQLGSPVMVKPQTNRNKPQHNRIRICFAVWCFVFRRTAIVGVVGSHSPTYDSKNLGG